MNIWVSIRFKQGYPTMFFKGTNEGDLELLQSNEKKYQEYKSIWRPGI